MGYYLKHREKDGKQDIRKALKDLSDPSSLRDEVRRAEDVLGHRHQRELYRQRSRRRARRWTEALHYDPSCHGRGTSTPAQDFQAGASLRGNLRQIFRQKPLQFFLRRVHRLANVIAASFRDGMRRPASRRA